MDYLHCSGVDGLGANKALRLPIFSTTANKETGSSASATTPVSTKLYELAEV